MSCLNPLSSRLNCPRDSVSLKLQANIRKTVPKNGATLAEAIFVIVCVGQWNIEFILRVPLVIRDFSPLKFIAKIVCSQRVQRPTIHRSSLNLLLAS